MALFPGLGTFAESALGTYKTLHGMGTEDETLRIKRRLAEEEARKRQLEEQKLRMEIERQQAEDEELKALASEMGTKQPHEITGAIPGYLGRTQRPGAAAAAAKKYQEAFGGARPWGERTEERTRAEFDAIVGLHRRGRATIQDVADEAQRLNIPRPQLELQFPDIAAKLTAAEAEARARGTKVGEAAGVVSALPGRPGTVGGILARQAGAEEAAKVGGRVEAEARTDITPMAGQFRGIWAGRQPTPQDVKVEEARRIAEARETELDRLLKQAQLKLKQAQGAKDADERAKLKAETATLLVTAEHYAKSIPATDPRRKELDLLLDQAGKFATSIDAPAPMPGRPIVPPPVAPPGALTPPRADGKVKVLNKATGTEGWVSPQFLNTGKYERR